MNWQRDALAARALMMADSARARWAMWGMLRMVENAYLQVDEGVLPGDPPCNCQAEYDLK